MGKVGQTEEKEEQEEQEERTFKRKAQERSIRLFGFSGDSFSNLNMHVVTWGRTLLECRAAF